MDGVLVVLVVEVVLVALFVRMAFDVFAVRRMLENAGLDSDAACGWCRLPVPRGADVCGHCGRELEPALPAAGSS
jgi:predicted amidophosphoribosyltransferase